MTSILKIAAVITVGVLTATWPTHALDATWPAVDATWPATWPAVDATWPAVDATWPAV